MTSSKLTLALVGLFVVMVLMGVASTGIRHVEVVVNNVVLVEQNDSLKSEVRQLKSNLDSTSVLVIDSISKAARTSDSLNQVIISKLDSTEQKLNHAELNSITNPYNTSPYRLEPIDLPSPEDN